MLEVENELIHARGGNELVREEERSILVVSWKRLRKGAEGGHYTFEWEMIVVERQYCNDSLNQ